MNCYTAKQSLIDLFSIEFSPQGHTKPICKDALNLKSMSTDDILSSLTDEGSLEFCTVSLWFPNIVTKQVIEESFESTSLASMAGILWDDIFGRC